MRTTTRVLDSLRRHWPEYLMEGAGLGLFMLSACIFTVLLEHPGSSIHQAIEDPLARRALIGVAMGLTAISIICSPWGQRSGAHLNPSVTLSFLMLGKIERLDAAFYIAAQFVGGITGVLSADLLIGLPLRDSAVNYATTAPGPAGSAVAFAAELLISFTMMSAVLYFSNSDKLSRLTPLIAGALVATYIAIEAPFSGMSMNPARTLASAFSAQQWTALWIYFSAPPMGMLLAALFYKRRRGLHNVFCAKLHHFNNKTCIFNCNYGELGIK